MNMTFGKYRGRSIAEVAQIDPDYLDWAVSNADKCRAGTFLGDQIRAELAKIKSGPQTPAPTFAQPDNALAKEVGKLRAENFRLAADAADVPRLRAEVARLKVELADLEQEKVALRRAGLNGSAQTVKAWWTANFKRLALLAHPDRGGSVELMQLLNELNGKVK